MLNHCCVWIGNLLGAAGEKGFSLVAASAGGQRFFKLRAQALEREIAEQLSAVDLRSLPEGFLRDSAGRPAAISASMELPIAFCPHCGADLKSWIEEHPQEFDELVEAGGQLL